MNRRERQAGLMAVLDDAEREVDSAPAARSDASIPVMQVAGGLVRDELRAARENVDALRAELELARQHGAVVKLDASRVRHGRFRDRHDLGFKDEAFAALKVEIEATNGNVLPILVRPIADQGYEYEVVWGHRRHQACVELGLPVTAVVRELSDREAVLLMSAENSSRKDLTQFEKARKYEVWISEGVFESMAEIAQAERVDKGTISRYMAINKLPATVVERIADPRTITGLWATKVLAVLKDHEQASLEKIASLPVGQTMTVRALLDLLTPPRQGEGLSGSIPEGEGVTYRVGDDEVLTVVPGAAGPSETVVRVGRPMTQDQLQKVADFIATL